MKSTASGQKPVALVTGASSGIGRLTAQQLAMDGFRTFGTSRSSHCSVENVEMMTLDVQRDDSVSNCINQIQEKAGHISVVVNNAGVLNVGIAEEHSAEEIRAVFETNFFGVVRVVNAVLPEMREMRSGKIINISSLAGLLAPPGEALYAASKFAVEGYSEALSYEVSPFGISVSLIEPGFVKTDINQSVPQFKNSPSKEFSDYDSFREPIRRALEKSVKAGSDPQQIAQLISQVARSKRTKLRYRAGSDAIWLPRLRGWVPPRLYDWGVGQVFGISELR